MIAPLAWDSEFWGCRVGRAETAGDLRWPAGFDLVYLLVPAADHAAAQEATGRGARLMDFRVEFEATPAAAAGVSRPARPGDMDALAGVARSAFRGLTRFYADPRLPDGRCDDLYEAWLRSSPNVLMVGDGSGPVGFVTVDVKDDTASIGLVAVAERARGRGMGENLVRSAVNWAHERGCQRMTVITQGRNRAARRTFQRCGFVTASTGVWLHWWAAA